MIERYTLPKWLASGRRNLSLTYAYHRIFVLEALAKQKKIL